MTRALLKVENRAGLRHDLLEHAHPLRSSADDMNIAPWSDFGQKRASPARAMRLLFGAATIDVMSVDTTELRKGGGLACSGRAEGENAGGYWFLLGSVTQRESASPVADSSESTNSDLRDRHFSVSVEPRPSRN